MALIFIFIIIFEVIPRIKPGSIEFHDRFCPDSNTTDCRESSAFDRVFGSCEEDCSSVNGTVVRTDLGWLGFGEKCICRYGGTISDIW